MYTIYIYIYMDKVRQDQVREDQICLKILILASCEK